MTVPLPSGRSHLRHPALSKRTADSAALSQVTRRGAVAGVRRSGTVIAGGCVQRFFLEWDRGTERLPVLALKLARYADFYQSCRARTEAPPALLLVTTTPQREELVRRVGRAAMGPSVDHLMTTTASLLERLGPFQAVWRCQDEEHRKRWPARASDHDDSLEVRR